MRSLETELNSKRRRQKERELVHVSMFLMILNDGVFIKEIRERPDFLLGKENKTYGLEHSEIVNEDFKRREGGILDVFEQAKSELIDEGNLPNILVNCHIRSDFVVKQRSKRTLILEIKNLLKDYIATGIIDENQIISRIYSYEHHEPSLTCNLGAWWQDYINNDSLGKIVNSKNLKNLFDNKLDENWLLLVIGGHGQSSFVIDEPMELLVNVSETNFDKIYLLEESSMKLYEFE